MPETDTCMVTINKKALRERFARFQAAEPNLTIDAFAKQCAGMIFMEIREELSRATVGPDVVLTGLERVN